MHTKTTYKHWRIATYVLLIIFLTVTVRFVWLFNKSWKIVVAARDGNILVVQNMLNDGIEANIKCPIGGLHPISTAAYSGHIEIVQILLDHGANPTYGLPQAILMNHPKIVQLLVAHGANVHHWQGYDKTPLQFAKEHGTQQIVGYLRDAGAK